MAKTIGGMIDAIELLNEPAGFLGNDYLQVLRQFWQNGYDELRAVAGENLKIVIGDAFVGVEVGFLL
jgi:glucan 1,3-beta-glucosidase